MTKVRFQDRLMSLSEAVERAGNVVSPSTAKQRINSYGWSVEDAVTVPPLDRTLRQRNAEIVKRLRETSVTLEALGSEYGLTRERVRQIGKRFAGITRKDRPNGKAELSPHEIEQQKRKGVRGRLKGPETISVPVRMKRETYDILHVRWHACGVFPTFSSYLRNELEKLAEESKGNAR
jgi:Sigma-70, region 4